MKNLLSSFERIGAMKKFITLLLILTFAVSMLLVGTGCKTTTTTETTAAATTGETAAETTAAAGEKIILNIWDWETSSGFKKYFDFIEKTFEAEHPNVDVVWTSMDFSLYFEALKTAIAGGEGPDLFNLQPGADTVQFRDAGQILDLTSIIEGDKEWASWVKDIDSNIEDTRTDGKIYRVPESPNHLAVFYWREMYPNGFPKTLAEMYTESAGLNSKGITPITVGWKDIWSIVDIFSTYVDQMDPNSPQMKRDADAGKISWENEVFKNALLTIKEMYDKGVFPKDALALTYGTQALENFLNKKAAAMWPAGTWILSGLNTKDTIDNDNIGTALLPVYKEGASTIMLGGNGASPAVAAYSKNQELAIEFAKLFDRPDAQAVLYDNWITPAVKVDKVSDNHVFVELTDRQFSHKLTYRYVNTPELYQGVADNIALLLTGTPVEKCLANLEAISKKVHPDAEHAAVQ
ncbi:MAG: extracellular solute-binding protein [Candidatus Humimicrobiaceae bacterium]